MKLQLDCTWNDKKNRAKQTIHFDYCPKSIFGLPREKILLVQNFSQTAHLEGPAALKNIEELVRRFPKVFMCYLTIIKFYRFLSL